MGIPSRSFLRRFGGLSSVPESVRRLPFRSSGAGIPRRRERRDKRVRRLEAQGEPGESRGVPGRHRVGAHGPSGLVQHRVLEVRQARGHLEEPEEVPDHLAGSVRPDVAGGDVVDGGERRRPEGCTADIRSTECHFSIRQLHTDGDLSDGLYRVKDTDPINVPLV